MKDAEGPTNTAPGVRIKGFDNLKSLDYESRKINTYMLILASRGLGLGFRPSRLLGFPRLLCKCKGNFDYSQTVKNSIT